MRRSRTTIIIDEKFPDGHPRKVEIRGNHENKEDLWKVADPNDPTRVEITYDDSQQASFRIAA